MLLIKLEILLLFISFGYIVYYFGDKIHTWYKNVNGVVNPQKATQNVKSSRVNLDMDKKVDLEDYKNVRLTDSQREKLTEIIKRVKINAEKGYFDTAKQLIIEGLAFDKYNKELNLQLAGIYEKENNYKKAKYIYKELINVFSNDAEVYKKLGYVYAMDDKLEEALVAYEKVFKKKCADFEVIRMLADISYDMKKFKKSLKYTNLFLKEKPRDTDKLLMKAVCLEKLSLPEDAIEVYKRILQLQPYNTVARDQIKKLSEA